MWSSGFRVYPGTCPWLQLCTHRGRCPHRGISFSSRYVLWYCAGYDAAALPYRILGVDVCNDGGAMCAVPVTWMRSRTVHRMIKYPLSAVWNVRLHLHLSPGRWLTS